MAWEPQKNQIWHEMLADLLILNPTLTNEECAEQLGLHYMTVRAVRSGDMFKAMMERRRDRISGQVEENYMDRLQGKVARLAETSVDALTQQVEAEQKALHNSVQRGSLETCEMALSALGFIGRGKPQAAPVSVNMQVVVDNTVLTAAREKMRALHANASSGADGGEVGDPARLPAPAQLP